MVAMDHIGTCCPSPQSYKHLTTCYDEFSCYSKSISTKRVDAFSTTVNLAMHWICVVGPPNSMLMDLGSDFRGERMKPLTSRLATEHRFTTAHHPRSDEGVEWFNGTVQQASCAKRFFLLLT